MLTINQSAFLLGDELKKDIEQRFISSKEPRKVFIKLSLEKEKEISANQLKKLIERMENKEKVELSEIDTVMWKLQVIDRNIMCRDNDIKYKTFKE